MGHSYIQNLRRESVNFQSAIKKVAAEYEPGAFGEALEKRHAAAGDGGGLFGEFVAEPRFRELRPMVLMTPGTAADEG